MFSLLVTAGGTTVDTDDDGAETDDGRLTVVAARHPL